MFNYYGSKFIRRHPNLAIFLHKPSQAWAIPQFDPYRNARHNITASRPIGVIFLITWLTWPLNCQTSWPELVEGNMFRKPLNMMVKTWENHVKTIVSYRFSSSTHPFCLAWQLVVKQQQLLLQPQIPAWPQQGGHRLEAIPLVQNGPIRTSCLRNQHHISQLLRLVTEVATDLMHHHLGSYFSSPTI